MLREKQIAGTHWIDKNSKNIYIVRFRISMKSLADHILQRKCQESETENRGNWKFENMEIPRGSLLYLIYNNFILFVFSSRANHYSYHDYYEFNCKRFTCNIISFTEYINPSVVKELTSRFAMNGMGKDHVELLEYIYAATAQF